MSSSFPLVSVRPERCGVVRSAGQGQRKPGLGSLSPHPQVITFLGAGCPSYSGASRGPKRGQQVQAAHHQAASGRAPPPPPACQPHPLHWHSHSSSTLPVLGPQALSGDGSAQLPAENAPSQGQGPGKAGVWVTLWELQRTLGTQLAAYLPTNKRPFFVCVNIAPQVPGAVTPMKRTLALLCCGCSAHGRNELSLSINEMLLVTSA